MHAGELKGCEAIREFRRRKQAEQDAAIIRNRLLQLERQAEKAQKRILQTRQRAKEVVAHRERNAQREKEKLELVRDLETSIEHHRQAIAKYVSVMYNLCLTRGTLNIKITPWFQTERARERER